MSKPRNPLLQMPEEHQAKLADWLLGGMPYHEANVLVEKELGVKASSSLERYTRFWEAVCVPQLLLRRQRMAGTAEQRADAAVKNPGRFDAATLDALRQKAYELAESTHADPKEVKAIMTLLLKARDQQLDEQRLQLDERKMVLLEKKAAAFDQAKGVLENKELTEAQRAARMREVFGIAS